MKYHDITLDFKFSLSGVVFGRVHHRDEDVSIERHSECRTFYNKLFQDVIFSYLGITNNECPTDLQYKDEYVV